MEDLVEKYKEECAVYSRWASYIWKIGLIILSVVYMFWLYNQQNILLKIILYAGSIIILYIICRGIFKRKVLEKIYSISNRSRTKLKKIKELQEEINKYQKDWMTNYCKKNKIRQILKLEILRNSLIEERKSNTIRYINPVIIGTLSLTIWEIELPKLCNKIGNINLICVGVLLSVVISIIVGIIKREFNEDKKIFFSFEKYANNERLEELLLYQILKLKK